MASQFVVEATFEMKKSKSLGPYFGKRAVYSLANAPDAVLAFDSSANLSAAIDQTVDPVYWITRTRNTAGADSFNSTKYTLISIGNAEPLIDLRLDHPNQIDPVVPAGRSIKLARQKEFTAPLGGPGTKVGELTVKLEGPAGDFYPLTIEAVGHATDRAQALANFANVFMVLARRAGGYGVMFVLGAQIAGDPATWRAEFCENTRGTTDPILQGMRAIAGC
ncbi:MAG: hypothetical protein HY868_11255 [Chloroflexi bacterium]|nr:hypothetical protein [Chloroflexota bacterium]